MKGLQPVTHSILADLESLSQRAPRKRTIDAQILDLFVNTRSNSKLSSPKKEYLRCRMIRGHKKSNRIICQKGISKKSILRYQLENPSAKSIWNSMETCYSENKSELGEICKTEFGPKTDGKRKRRNKFSETRNSFNDAFCKDYFNANSVRESYFYYVELLFANLDEKILEKTFELRCCQDGHNLKCLEKWLVLKKYLNFYMIEDLGLTAFHPLKNENHKLPSILTKTKTRRI